MHRRNFLTFALAASPLGTLRGALLQPSIAMGHDESDTIEGDCAGPSQGPWRRLFLDGSVVEFQQGLQKVFHAAEKHPQNPLLVADRPWEGKSAIIGPYAYGTVTRENGVFRFWHQVLFQGNHVAYAESRDGIHWTKPGLDVVRHQGEKTNLVVSAFQPDVSGGGYCHNPSVIRIPSPSQGNHRYALYGFDNHAGHPRVAFSQDGIHWKYPNESKEQPLFRSSDVVNFFYDPYQQRYIATWKTRNRRGRAVGVATSIDGVQWSKPYDGPLFSADDLDPSTTQIYGMPTFPYQGLYIGLPWIYEARYFRYGEYSVEKLYDAQEDSPRTMHTQLAWSWDLMQWTRPSERSPFIAIGEKDAWDRGMIVTARSPVLVDDKLYFYYGGCDKAHDEKQVKAGIGLATLRLDGFCSMKPKDEVGWLVSRREPMLEPSILINARTSSAGSIRAELLDKKNRVIDGFSKEDSIPFQGDSVAAELKWQKSTFDAKKKPKDCKIKFWLDRAELFSYLPVKLDPNEPDLARFQRTGP